MVIFPKVTVNTGNLKSKTHKEEVWVGLQGDISDL